MRTLPRHAPRSTCGVVCIAALLVVVAHTNILGAEEQSRSESTRQEFVGLTSSDDRPAVEPPRDNLLATIAGLQIATIAPHLPDLLQVASAAAWAQDYKHALERVHAARPNLPVVKAKLKDFDDSLLGATQTVAPAVGVISKVVNADDTKVPANVIYVRFSKPFLETYFCKQFDKTMPVRDNVLGAEVYGTSRTIARTELGLADNPNAAQASILFKGATAFNSTSYKGPVQIFSHGTTQFTSEKKLWFDGTDIRQSDPKIIASTKTITDGISTDLPGLRRRIALRIAGNREAESHALAEEIATERTKRKVATAFDEVVRERTVAFRDRLREQYANLPFRGRFTLQAVQCSTTPDSLQIVVLGRGEGEPTYAATPPILKEGPDVELHIHTALVQKAIFDPDMRATLQLALQSIVDNPMKVAPGVVRTAATSEAHRELHIHWSEGEGEWLSLAWHAKEKPQLESKPTEVVSQRMVSMPLVAAPIPGR